MKATIIIWSRIGHTPLTQRMGAYCDVLRRETVTVSSLAEALSIGRGLKQSTPHADRGHVAIPELANQNFRSIWI